MSQFVGKGSEGNPMYFFFHKTILSLNTCTCVEDYKFISQIILLLNIWFRIIKIYILRFIAILITIKVKQLTERPEDYSTNFKIIL